MRLVPTWDRATAETCVVLTQPRPSQHTLLPRGDSVYSEHSLPLSDIPQPPLWSTSSGQTFLKYFVHN